MSSPAPNTDTTIFRKRRRQRASRPAAHLADASSSDSDTEATAARAATAAALVKSLHRKQPRGVSAASFAEPASQRDDRSADGPSQALSGFAAKAARDPSEASMVAGGAAESAALRRYLAEQLGEEPRPSAGRKRAKAGQEPASAATLAARAMRDIDVPLTKHAPIQAGVQEEDAEGAGAPLLLGAGIAEVDLPSTFRESAEAATKAALSQQDASARGAPAGPSAADATAALSARLDDIVGGSMTSNYKVHHPGKFNAASRSHGGPTDAAAFRRYAAASRRK